MKLKLFTLLSLVAFSGCHAYYPQQDTAPQNMSSAYISEEQTLNTNSQHEQDLLEDEASKQINQAESDSCRYENTLYGLGTIINMDGVRRVCKMSNPYYTRGMGIIVSEEQRQPMWKTYDGSYD